MAQPASSNQYYPGRPPGVEPQLWRSIEELWTRINYLITRLDAVPTQEALEARVRQSEVSLQAAADALTAGSAFVGFGNSQPISMDPTIGGSSLGLTFGGVASAITLTVTNAATFRTAISAAQSGSNADITALTVLQLLQLLDTTPAQITSDQNNYNPGTGSSFRLSTDAPRTITGLAGGADGRLMFLMNVGSFNFLLSNENFSSSAANRIITGTGADVTYPPDDIALVKYDATTARWRVVV